MQSALQQQLELNRDAAVHKQQLEVDMHVHALQLAQQAQTAAQTECDRLKQKNAQEMELCEVPHVLAHIVQHPLPPHTHTPPPPPPPPLQPGSFDQMSY